MNGFTRLTVILVLLALAVGGLWAIIATGRARQPPAASQPVTHPAGSTTTRTSQPVEKYPGEELVKACRQRAAWLRGKLDNSFRVAVHAPFVVAGNLPVDRLSRYTEQTVVRPAKAMWAGYFKNKPGKPITVLLFRNAATYKAWAKRLFGDEKVSYFGYYKPAERTMVMNINTGGGTLVHELTHALIAYDFPSVPTWFSEGLASLHEQCNVGDKQIVGLVNWRLPALQDAIGKGKLRPLRELVTKRDFYGALQGLNYAQGRYFVMYMQHRGLLRDFYRHFRDNHTQRDADIKAIEHVFGKGIEAVEKDYLAWVVKLRFRR